MKNTFHGIFSMLLFVLAIAVALLTLWQQSPWLGLLYLAICGLSSGGILFTYCGKCSVRLDNCSHVFPGKLTRFLPRRKQGPYSFADIAGTVLLLGLIILFPQYWLLQQITAMALFWLLAGIAISEILLFVCRKCQNSECLMCPNFQKPEVRTTEDGSQRSEDVGNWLFVIGYWTFVFSEYPIINIQCPIIKYSNHGMRHEK